MEAVWRCLTGGNVSGICQGYGVSLLPRELRLDNTNLSCSEHFPPDWGRGEITSRISTQYRLKLFAKNIDFWPAAWWNCCTEVAGYKGLITMIWTRSTQLCSHIVFTQHSDHYWATIVCLFYELLYLLIEYKWWFIIWYLNSWLDLTPLHCHLLCSLWWM